MRVFLDDERPTPEGWVRVWWPDEAIALLEGGEVTELSLDHDLGDDARGTGYDVVLWIEEAVALRGFKPPKIIVHSANSSARIKMQAGIAAIETDRLEEIYADIARRRPDLLHPNGQKPTKRPWGSTEFGLLDSTSVCVVLRQW